MKPKIPMEKPFDKPATKPLDAEDRETQGARMAKALATLERDVKRLIRKVEKRKGNGAPLRKAQRNPYANFHPVSPLASSCGLAPLAVTCNDDIEGMVLKAYNAHVHFRAMLPLAHLAPLLDLVKSGRDFSNLWDH